MLQKLGITTKPKFYSSGENKYMAAVANRDNSSVDRSGNARFLESVHQTNAITKGEQNTTRYRELCPYMWHQTENK